MLDELSGHARWFVAAAWLLLILAFAMSILVGAASGIAVFYHPLHQNTPFHLAHLDVAEAAFYVAIIIAVGSSIALLLRKPLLASVSVILALVLFPIGAMIRLSFAQLGPEEFQRYIGNERLIIPWTFNPRGDDKPNSFGFLMQLCVENLRGNYDLECRDTTQLIAEPRQRGFLASSDMDFFQKHVANMSSIAPRNNHQGYEYRSPSDSSGQVRAERYYILRDDGGNRSVLRNALNLEYGSHGTD